MSTGILRSQTNTVRLLVHLCAFASVAASWRGCIKAIRRPVIKLHTENNEKLADFQWNSASICISIIPSLIKNIFTLIFNGS